VDDLRGEMHRLKALAAAGRRGDARELARTLLADARTVGYQPLLAEALFHDAFGEAYLDGGDIEHAARGYYEAATIAARAGDTHLVAEAWIWLMMAEGYGAARYKEALAMRPFAEAATAAAGDDPVLDARLKNVVAIILDEMGDHVRAQELFAASLSLRERALGAAHPDVAASHSNLADSLHRQGRFEEARVHLERAFAINEIALGPQHPDNAFAAQNLGNVLLSLGELSAARRYTELAIDRYRLARRDGVPPPASALANLGLIKLREGDVAGAVVILERASSIAEKDDGAEHPSTALVLDALGQAYARSGNHAGAITAFERAATVFDSHFGADDQRAIASRRALDAVRQRTK
jgi:tetratricopeptide (TPR) repeat protein